MPAATPAVTLEFLLVSGDASTASTVGAALQEIGAAVECAASVEAARELIVSHKVDGVIFDVDIKAALDLIARMRRSKNARAFAFVCVKNDAEEAVALKGGATALLSKPLSVEAIAAKIGSFKSIIASERRRYRRHDVTLPLVVTLGDVAYPGIIENISQGGLAARLPCLLPNAAVVEFSFDLESGVTIEGSAQLRWANREGLTGVEFRTLPPKSKADFAAWLKQKAAEPSPEDLRHDLRGLF